MQWRIDNTALVDAAVQSLRRSLLRWTAQPICRVSFSSFNTGIVFLLMTGTVFRLTTKSLKLRSKRQWTLLTMSTRRYAWIRTPRYTTKIKNVYHWRSQRLLDIGLQRTALKINNLLKNKNEMISTSFKMSIHERILYFNSVHVCSCNSVFHRDHGISLVSHQDLKRSVRSDHRNGRTLNSRHSVIYLLCRHSFSQSSAMA